MSKLLDKIFFCKTYKEHPDLLTTFIFKYRTFRIKELEYAINRLPTTRWSRKPVHINLDNSIHQVDDFHSNYPIYGRIILHERIPIGIDSPGTITMTAINEYKTESIQEFYDVELIGDFKDKEIFFIAKSIIPWRANNDREI
jgi:hypothetical protein